MCTNHSTSYCDPIPDRVTSRREGLFCVMVQRGHCWQEGIVVEPASIHGAQTRGRGSLHAAHRKEEAGAGRGSAITSKFWSQSSSLLVTNASWPPKSPRLCLTVPPAEVHILKCMSTWGTFYILTTIVSIHILIRNIQFVLSTGPHGP